MKCKEKDYVHHLKFVIYYTSLQLLNIFKARKDIVLIILIRNAHSTEEAGQCRQREGADAGKLHVRNLWG